jgi:hypothetical protein
MVERGSVSCREARSLIKAFGEGKGTVHLGVDQAQDYTSFPGGWRCELENGDVGCGRGRLIRVHQYGETYLGYATAIDGTQL